MRAKASHAVTQAEVARAAGVSRGLVSMALAGSPRVAEDTRRQILATAERLGYRLNRSAATLASGRSGLVGLVLPDLRNPFFDSVAVCLQRCTQQAGLTLLMTLATFPDEGARVGSGGVARLVGPAALALGGTQGAPSVLSTLLDMRVEGLVLVSPGMDDARLRRLATQVPVCVIGRASAGGLVDTVRVDEAEAARVVVDHLRQCAARELVYLTPPRQEDPNSAERGQALRQAAAQAGLPLSMIESASQGAQRVREQADRAAGRGVVLGVIAHNDVVALDALAALRGARVPAPLVSYDDTYLAQREEFSLTSVQQPVETMAADAIRFVCERSGRVPADPGTLAGSRDVTVSPVLSVRSSSRAAGEPGAQVRLQS